MYALTSDIDCAWPPKTSRNKERGQREAVEGLQQHDWKPTSVMEWWVNSWLLLREKGKSFRVYKEIMASNEWNSHLILQKHTPFPLGPHRFTFFPSLGSSKFHRRQKQTATGSLLKGSHLCPTSQKKTFLQMAHISKTSPLGTACDTLLFLISTFISQITNYSSGVLASISLLFLYFHCCDLI